MAKEYEKSLAQKYGPSYHDRGLDSNYADLQCKALADS